MNFQIRFFQKTKKFYFKVSFYFHIENQSLIKYH